MAEGLAPCPSARWVPLPLDGELCSSRCVVRGGPPRLWLLPKSRPGGGQGPTATTTRAWHSTHGGRCGGIRTASGVPGFEKQSYGQTVVVWRISYDFASRTPVSGRPLQNHCPPLWDNWDRLGYSATRLRIAQPPKGGSTGFGHTV
ncbi:unnamed protein product [Arctogadus glacialis]